MASKKEESAEADGDEVKYGVRSCTPSWIQWCSNPKAMLFWLSWFATVQGLYKKIHYVMLAQVRESKRDCNRLCRPQGLQSLKAQGTKTMLLQVTEFQA